jgi:hypothetical protein
MLASRASVIPLMAETTTTGRSSRRSATILATRRNAPASSTEVPPNFITIDWGVVITSLDFPSRKRTVCATIKKKKLIGIEHDQP